MHGQNHIKHPFMLSLETLFSLLHQNKPKMFPSSFFSLPSTLPSPCYCLLFLNAFYTRFGFFVRLIPTNRGSCTHITVSHLAITPHMENEREEQIDRQTDNPDVRQCLDRQLTLFAKRYKSTTKLIKYKEFDIASSTDFVIHQCCYEMLISKHIYIYISWRFMNHH